MNLRPYLSLASALPLLVSLVGCKPSAPDEPCAARVARMREVFTSIPSEAIDGVFFEQLRASELIVSEHAQTAVDPDVIIELLATGRFVMDNKNLELESAKGALTDEIEKVLAMAALTAQKNDEPPSDGSRRSERPTEMAIDEGSFVGYLKTPDRPPGESPEAPRALKSAPGVRIYLAIAPGAPLADLSALLAEVPGDAFVSIVVRMARELPTEAGLAQPIRAALQEVKAHMAAELEDRRLANDGPNYIDTMMTCPDFAPLARRPKQGSYLERQRMWLAEVPQITLDCGCEGVKVELLTAMIWYLRRPDLPVLGVLPLRYSFAPDPAEALPATARGVDLVRRIEQRGALPIHMTLPPPP